MKWSTDELTLAVAEVARGRTYAQVARTLNSEFHQRRTVRTGKSVELKLRREDVPAASLRPSSDTEGGAVVWGSPTDPALPETAPATVLEQEVSGDTQILTSRSTQIKTLDELLAATQVDPLKWKVSNCKLTKWDVGAKGPDGRIVTAPLFGVKVHLQEALHTVAAREERDALLDDVSRSAPYVLVRNAPNALDLAVEFALMDVHLGKYAWAEETGEDYDLETAEAEVKRALEVLLERSMRHNPKRALLPLGNDAFHIDNRLNTTTAGTLMDADTRYWRILRRGRKLFSNAIRTLAKEVGPVDVLIVPGNHDENTVLVLGELLHAEFDQHPFVNIDNSLYPRKYWRFGTVLLGFTHGNDERHADLPLLMANEQPEAWAATTHHEWHTGHFHKSKETRFTAGDSFGGVRVRTLPALSGTDAWHAKKGYVGELRSAEAYLWYADAGYGGHLAYTNRVPKLIDLMEVAA